MSAETFGLISLISYILAGILLLLAVFFWFYFKMPAVIGYLTGRTARKAVEQIRKGDSKPGKKSYSPPNRKKAPAQQPVKPRKPVAQMHAGSAEHPETTLAEENLAVGAYGEQTTVLDEATTLLRDDDATTLLSEVPVVKRAGGMQLTMLTDVMLIHTDEVI